MERNMECNLKHWIGVLEDSWPDLFLVGGAVRDRLLRRQPGDMDFMCRDAEKMARRVAERGNGVVVPFEKKPGEPCYRVVDRNDPDDHLDIAEMRGGSLTADLGQRDFTVNAIGLPVTAGVISHGIVDPFHGGKGYRGSAHPHGWS